MPLMPMQTGGRSTINVPSSLTLSNMSGHREVLAERRHRLAPPPWRIFLALTEEVEQWLTLRPGETPPQPIRSTRPSLVEWSSMWPVSPTDSIVFTITPDGEGCAVTLHSGSRPTHLT